MGIMGRKVGAARCAGLRAVLAAVLCALPALMLTACHAPPPRPPAPSASAAPAHAASAAGAAAAPAAPASPPAGGTAAGTRFRIDSGQSELRIFIYRAGAMAALGHNHVIANRRLEGWVHYPGAIEGASFELQVPTAGFSVDEPARRRAAGKDFSDEVDDEARRGTLDNMLGPSVLAASAHPTILVSGRSVAGTMPHLNAKVSIEVAGHTSMQVAPFDLILSGDTLRAHGAFELKQSALGLTPFSIFLGALRVEDTMRLELDLTAVRVLD